MSNNWDYNHGQMVFGINRSNYFTPKNSRGTIDDVLHPAARCTLIEKSYGHTFRNTSEKRPALVVIGSRPGFLWGIKEFEVIIVAEPPKEQPTLQDEVPREEQERRLNALVDYLTLRKN